MLFCLHLALRQASIWPLPRETAGGHWTVERLTQKHPSQPYNPDIANAYFRAGMIEAWGRGIELVIRACKEAGLVPPELSYEATGLTVEFAIPQRSGAKASGTTQKTTQKTLAILRENPKASRREITEAIAGITGDGVKYHLEKLKESG